MSNGPAASARIVMDILREKGFQVFLVGGCVRDSIMGLEPKDYDVATDATPDQVMEVFPHTVAVGASFGVVRIQINEEEVEVATFRADGEYTDGRRPNTVSFSKTLQEDMIRRDFTINGLALDIDGKMVDLVGGLRDIQNSVIRAIGDPYKRIEEDSLRMLRAVRFAARFDYEIEPETKIAIIKMAYKIHRVSQERITDEILKMLGGPRPAKALALLSETTLLTEIFPEFAANSGDFFCRNEDLDMPKILRLARILPKMEILNTALVSTNNPIVGLVVMLSELTDEQFFAILERMKLNNKDKEIATNAFTFRNKLNAYAYQSKVDDATVIRFMRLPGRIEAFTVFRIECVCGAKENQSLADVLLQDRMVKLHDRFRAAPLITGRDLIAAGFTPGPVFTLVLREVETLQLNGTISTPEQALRIVKIMIAAETGTLQVRQE